MPDMGTAVSCGARDVDVGQDDVVRKADAGEALEALCSNASLSSEPPHLCFPQSLYVYTSPLYVRSISTRGADEGAVEGEQQSQSTWDSLARGAHWPS